MSGESNGDWGVLVEHDNELAETWDTFSRLPEPGENAALDAFVEAKGISIASLLRVGAKLSAPTVLAFAYPGGIKYRDMVTGQRWSFIGSTWQAMKIVRHGAMPTSVVIVAEGETDGAKLSECYDVDVAVMPAGARYFPREYADQLESYDRVLIGLDSDEAGEDGAAKIMEWMPHAERFAPPEGCNDWCDTPDEMTPEIPAPPERPALQLLVPAGAMLELEVPEIASWFEHDILPIGGLAIIHGWAKSFKSFLGLDMLAALAQGLDWLCFEPTEEPCRTAVMQYEIPWAYYRQRVAQIKQHAREPELFNENFLTWTPLQRPRLRAGDTKAEDQVLKALDEAGVQVLLLDPIRRAMGTVSMNDEDEVRKMLMFFERCNEHGITVVATHHDNKTAGRSGGGDPLGMTGSGAWSGDPDTILSVELPRGDKLNTSTRRNVHFTLRNSPSIGPRAFEMHEDGRIGYATEPFGDWADDSDDDPSI